MATLSELQQQLIQVKAAISQILNGGQEYRFNDMQVDQLVKRADLKTLFEMQNSLESQIANISDSGGFYVS